MITRSRRTFPGVIVSLMLAAPAFATPALADPAADTHANHAPVRPATTRPAITRHALPRKRQARAAVHQDTIVRGGDPSKWSQVGMASWYGGARWHGKLTASGARYDEAGLTAAHATLPLGSHVRVTVADTGRSVIVTINDRPGSRSRVIDLSRGAAQALGILSRGVAKVTLQPV